MTKALFGWAAVAAGCGVLIACLALAYRLAIGLPAEAAAHRSQYRDCLSAANAANSRRWAHRCSDQASSRPAQLTQCLAKAAMESDAGLRRVEEVDCRQELGVAPVGQCPLPHEEAQRLDATLHEARQMCLGELQATN